MLENSKARQQQRRAHIDSLLIEAGIARNSLAPSTLKCLEEWARQDLLVKDQPSANYWNVVMGLCRAVESQVAYSLGRVPGLEMLARKNPMGLKAHALREMVTSLDGNLGASTINELLRLRIKPTFVSERLCSLLLRLARIRSKTDSAHGNAVIEEATKQDASKARKLAQEILRGICNDSEGNAK